MAAQIADFKGVVVLEHVLHADIPLHRSGRNLVRDKAGSGLPRISGGEIAGRRNQFAIDAAVGQKCSVLENRREIIGVVGDALLGRIGGAADVVEDHVVSHAESRADRGPSAGARRIRNPYARCPTLVIGGRGLESDQAGDAGQRVQRMVCLAQRHRGALIADAEIDGQVPRHAPVVIRVVIVGPLIAIVIDLAQVALGKVARDFVQQKLPKHVVIVIATLALNEVLGRNRVADVKSKLERVLPFSPVEVLHQLIGVLNGPLRRVGVGD